jgi:probable HAF family extracellular repeat protein
MNRMLIFAAAACAVLLCPAAWTATYTCTVFTYGSPDWVVTPTGINNSGQVVGYATDPNGSIHGFLRNTDGSFEEIGAPAAAGVGWTKPQAINNKGQIAGMYQSMGTPQGFVRNADGTYTDIAPPVPPDNAGPGSTIFGFLVTGINDQGIVSGVYHIQATAHLDKDTYVYRRDPDGTYHVVYGSYPDLGTGPLSAGLNNALYDLEYGGTRFDALLRKPDGSGAPLTFPGLPTTQFPASYTSTSGLNNNLATAGTLLNVNSGFIRTAAGNITGVFCPRDISADISIAGINDGSAVVGTFTRNSKVKGFIGIPTYKAPHVTLSDTSHDFGITGGKSQPFRIFLKNDGPGALHIQALYGGIETIGRPAPFIVSDTDCAPATGATDIPFAKGKLKRGATCYVDIVYKPTGPEAESGNVYILDDAPDSPQIMSFTGTGVLSTVRISNLSWDFGAQPLGHTTGDGVIYIYNQGPVDVSVDSVSITSNPAEFAVSGTTCSPTLAAYTTCNIRFNFSPGAAGERYGVLTVNATGAWIPPIALQGWAQ